MRGTADSGRTYPCLRGRLCQQKVVSHHGLDTEGIHFLLWTEFSVGTAHLGDAV